MPAGAIKNRIKAGNASAATSKTMQDHITGTDGVVDESARICYRFYSKFYNDHYPCSAIVVQEAPFSFSQIVYLVLPSSSLTRTGRLRLHGLMKSCRVRLIRDVHSSVTIQRGIGRRSLIYGEAERHYTMKCSICGRISANGDHADCAERLRIELEDENQKRTAAERTSLDGAELGAELRALLNHMGSQRRD